jgi:hypothetical protein
VDYSYLCDLLISANHDTAVVIFSHFSDRDGVELLRVIRESLDGEGLEIEHMILIGLLDFCLGQDQHTVGIYLVVLLAYIPILACLSCLSVYVVNIMCSISRPSPSRDSLIINTDSVLILS